MVIFSRRQDARRGEDGPAALAGAVTRVRDGGSAWRRLRGNGAAAVARGAESEAKFLDSVGIGPSYRFKLAELVDADLRRMAELVRRYADQRLGGTDASVIAICERLSITTVATVNRQQIRPVMIEGAEPMDRIFPTLGAGDEDRR